MKDLPHCLLGSIIVALTNIQVMLHVLARGRRCLYIQPYRRTQRFCAGQIVLLQASCGGKLCPFGVPSERPSADFPEYERNRYAKTPPQLFRCATLRRMRLTNWVLDLPWDFGVASSWLETIFLKRIMAPNGVIQQLLSACPRLADLTLEECPGAREIVVPSDSLRTFAMICCHNANRVVVRTSCLRSLQYKGGLFRDARFIDVASYDHVSVVTIDICEDLTSKGPQDVAPLAELISRCKNLTYLFLALHLSMAYYCNLFTAVAGHLPKLRQLVLKGFLAADHTGRADSYERRRELPPRPAARRRGAAQTSLHAPPEACSRATRDAL